jgi:predicted GNAT family N-acyltransferase
VPEALERDEHDADAIHLLASDDAGRAIATARLLRDGHIGRMAVLPDMRNRGIGSRLLTRLLDLAAERDMATVFLHAQCQAEPFYARLGFTAEGEVFKDAGIDHRYMRLLLEQRPVAD